MSMLENLLFCNSITWCEIKYSLKNTMFALLKLPELCKISLIDFLEHYKIANFAYTCSKYKASIFRPFLSNRPYFSSYLYACLEKGSDQLFVYRGIDGQCVQCHKQLIRILFEAHIVPFWFNRVISPVYVKERFVNVFKQLIFFNAKTKEKLGMIQQAIIFEKALKKCLLVCTKREYFLKI